MRILYDGEIYVYQAAGGISRYFANLIERLPAQFQPHLMTVQSEKILYPQHPRLRSWVYHSFRPSQLAVRLKKHYFRCVSSWVRPDVIHPTYYSQLTEQCKIHRTPVVLTVYDLIHELYRDRIDPDGSHAALKQHAIQSADHILCISQQTRSDLIRFYAVPDDRITVTPLASDLDQQLSYGDQRVPERPYFLYVGSRDIHYKNFDGLLVAFSQVVATYPDVQLCVVGNPFSQSELQMMVEAGVEHHINYYGQVDDAHLAKLYRCSVAFVYPSMYEGFGIPLLEAMACGTPAIACNTASIPEVVGDAGLLFQPGQLDELADLMQLVLTQPLQREASIQAGHRQAKQFSWDKTAAQTLKVYHSLA